MHGRSPHPGSMQSDALPLLQLLFVLLLVLLLVQSEPLLWQLSKSKLVLEWLELGLLCGRLPSERLGLRCRGLGLCVDFELEFELEFDTLAGSLRLSPIHPPRRPVVVQDVDVAVEEATQVRQSGEREDAVEPVRRTELSKFELSVPEFWA